MKKKTENYLENFHFLKNGIKKLTLISIDEYKITKKIY